jgi:hypothetical protein
MAGRERAGHVARPRKSLAERRSWSNTSTKRCDPSDASSANTSPHAGASVALRTAVRQRLSPSSATTKGSEVPAASAATSPSAATTPSRSTRLCVRFSRRHTPSLPAAPSAAARPGRESARFRGRAAQGAGT